MAFYPCPTSSRASRIKARLALGTSLLALLATSACSVSGGAADQPRSTADGAVKEVVLVTHESFNLPKETLAAFTRKTGYTVTVNGASDAGALATKLAMTADNPAGDVAFGIDNTYATRPLEAGAFADYDGARPAGSQGYDLPEGADKLVPIDTAGVCVNVDTDWFTAHKIAPPATLDDLVDPAYRDLFVTPAPTTSSPGMAFLLTTIAAKGEQWPAYWKALYANGATTAKGWSEAYYNEFTAGGEKGKRPIVVSYDSSPAFTVNKDGRSSRTAALLDTCFNQVEYAGVLAGAKNPAGAAALVAFLASDEAQAQLPESMYVFPASPQVKVPADWATFALRPSKPFTVAPAEISQNREAWLRTWTDLATR